MERRVENRQPAHILVIFLIVQFTGLLIAVYTSTTGAYQTISQSSITSGSQQVGQTAILAAEVVAFIVIDAVVLLLILKFYHGNLLFKLLETYIIGFPTFYIALLLLSTAAPQMNAILALAISLIVAAALVIARNLKPSLINLAVVCSCIGIGVIVGGAFGFLFSYIFMAILAVYDYVAVFVTKHMITLAKGLMERNLAFVVGSSDTEIVPKGYLSENEKKEYLAQLKKSKPNDPLVKRLIAEGKVPTLSSVALGAGDLAVPLMLSSGIFIWFHSVFAAVMASVGATVGLLLTMYLLKKYKVALPAIPPLFAFMSLFLGITVLILYPGSYLNALVYFAIFFVTIGILIGTLDRISKRKITPVNARLVTN